MQLIIEDFVNDEKQKLKILEVAPGFGKTTTVIKYIQKMFNEMPDDKRKKIIFISPLIKNLDDFHNEVLKQNYKFDRPKVVQLYSANEEIQKAFADDELINSVPSFIKEIPEFNQLKKLCKSNRSTVAADIREAIDKQIEGKRRDLKTKIDAIFSERFPTVDERKKAIQEDDEWMWLGKFYPATQIYCADVVIMTAAKFYYPISTPIENLGPIYKSSVVKDRIVIFDESDSVKQSFENAIIQEIPTNTVNLIQFMKDIRAGLRQNDVDEITRPSSKNIKRDNTRETLSDIVRRNEEIVENIFRECYLQFPFRTEIGIDQKNVSFIFHDAEKPFYLSKQLYIDHKNHRNIISENKRNNSQALSHVLNRMNGFISKSLKTMIERLAENYMERKHESGDNGYTFDQSARTVMAHFGFSSFEIDFMINNYLVSNRKRRSQDHSEFDYSFYENGFQYFNLHNSPEHDTKTEIEMYVCSITPEKILMILTENAKVLLLSATATNMSALSNFNLNYLKGRIGSGFTGLTKDEISRLKEEAKKVYQYDSIEIKASIIGDCPQWVDIFSETRNLILCHKIFNSEKDYIQNRYKRFAVVFRHFVNNSDIQSLLCLENLLTNGPAFNREAIKQIATMIIEECNSKLDPETCIYYLDNREDGFEKKKKEMTNLLSNGNKLFVISTYQTVGSGQNLQYPIPKKTESELVKVNNRDYNCEKDFDAVYVELPTNQLVNPRSINSVEETLTNIYQTEELRASGEITENEKENRIKRLTTTKNKDIQSVREAVWKTVCQGVGRICRTNMKREKIRIFLHEEIAEYLPVLGEDHIYNPEIECAYKTLQSRAVKHGNEIKYQASAQLKNNYSKALIKDLLDRRPEGAFKEKNIPIWKSLRELTLKSPIISNEQYENLEYGMKNAFIKLPTPMNKYHYYQENDYSEVTISFSDSANNPYEVSSDSVQLDLLLKIREVCSAFDCYGYSKTWEQGDYALTPVIFNNIYKGALGETAGYEILHSVGIELKEIEDPSMFELFDFQTDRHTFVDFKYWKETDQVDEEQQIKKILDKAQVCDAKTIFIINVMAEGDYLIVDKNYDGVRIVQIPYLYQIRGNELIPNSEAIAYIKGNL